VPHIASHLTRGLPKSIIINSNSAQIPAINDRTAPISPLNAQIISGDLKQLSACEFLEDFLTRNVIGFALYGAGY